LLTPPATDTTFFNGAVELVMIKDTGSNFFTYSNGVAQSQAATNYTRGTSTLDTYCLGAKYNSGVVSDWFSGTLSEFIVINGALSIGDRERLEGYSLINGERLEIFQADILIRPSHQVIKENGIAQK